MKTAANDRAASSVTQSGSVVVAEKEKAQHQHDVGLIGVLTDFDEVSPEMIQTSDELSKYYEYRNGLDLPFKPLLNINSDITTDSHTAGSIGIELCDSDGVTQSIVCFKSDNIKQPYIVDTAPLCALPLGSMSHDGQWWMVDSQSNDAALKDGLILAYQLLAMDDKPDTVFVEFNIRRISQTARYLSKTKQINIITTADRVDSLKSQLKGCNVLIYPTISAITALESGSSLDDALGDCEPVHAQELAMPYLDGVIESKADGLYLTSYDDDGEPKRSSFICSRLEVLARSRDENSNSWGILLEWYDHDNIKHRWAMPAQYLQGDSREYRKELSAQGLKISTFKRSQQALSAYLTNHPTANRAICVDSVGWHGDAYVLPDVALNSGNQTIVYQPERPTDIIYTQQGTLDKWRDELCSKIAEQSRIAFAVSCAFSGQLLKLLGAESGGFHITGGSSMGKSIGLKVAGSVWGNPDKFIKRWRVTDNGLESVAATHNDSFLGLDEISEGDPKSVGNAAYMLANGQGKVRARAGGGNRPTATWRLMFLSNGEKTLDNYLRSAGIEVNAGQLVRLIHIEADAKKGYRSFDSLVFADNASEQANIIKQLSSRYYGVAGMAWLEFITKDRQAVADKAQDLIKQFLSNYSDLKEQAHRGAERFAIVAAAGELATEAGITGWQAGQATAASIACLDNWLETFGRDGSHEERQVIAQVKGFIEKHGSSRFQKWHQLYDNNEHRINNRAGWYKPDTDEYYFYTEAFSEVCGSYETNKVIQVLDDEGYLLKNEKNRKTFRTELPDGLKSKRIRMYCVKGSLLDYDAVKSTNH